MKYLINTFCSHTAVVFIHFGSSRCHFRNVCVGGLLCSCGQWFELHVSCHVLLTLAGSEHASELSLGKAWPVSTTERTPVPSPSCPSGNNSSGHYFNFHSYVTKLTSKLVLKISENHNHSFLEHNATSSNSLFCPNNWPKCIHISFTMDGLRKLEQGLVGCFGNLLNLNYLEQLFWNSKQMENTCSTQ